MTHYPDPGATGQAQAQRRKRKILAVLAAGLLLLAGGIATTLAIFSDSIFGSGTVSTGAFDIEADFGEIGGYQQYATAPGGAMQFPIIANAMYPGATVYAPITLRTTDVPNSDVPVKLIGATFDPPNALTAALLYSVKIIGNTATCDEATFAAAPPLIGFPTDATLSTGSGETTHVIPADHTPVRFCFALTLPTTVDNTTQDLSVTPVWQFLSIMG
ncbi:hypothetical protein OG921_09585 [Aldersonia sp. NBC_00410]|uniref:hypothetical protein n=1 Tax=Aldersonia sp. NBC_00410 TaxID=2975954 RepID=UPI002252AEED|nr:hypothetical protein [Aldersonia sp. NBC_00410]MCX5043422.1 hypothetical protein [Aldersonia sp. NBC_00410]